MSSTEITEITLITCVGVIVLGIIGYVCFLLFKSMGIEKFIRSIHKGLCGLLVLIGYWFGAKNIGVFPSSLYGALVGILCYGISYCLNNISKHRMIYYSLSLVLLLGVLCCIAIVLGDLSTIDVSIIVSIVLVILMGFIHLVLYILGNKENKTNL